MYLTLGQAAKATSKSKTTIANAIKNGRLSAVEKSSSGYKIDPAELNRVYPMTSNAPSTMDDARSPKLPDLDTVARLATAEAQVTVLRELIDELRSDRDHLRQAQLANQNQGSFWNRLFNRAG